MTRLFLTRLLPVSAGLVLGGDPYLLGPRAIHGQRSVGKNSCQ